MSTHEIAARRALEAIERRRERTWYQRAKRYALAVAIAAFFVESWRLAQVDLERFVSGLPKLAH
ncbi:hypothetical protein Q6293_29045, partial [Klebsiella pneumoniae]